MTLGAAVAVVLGVTACRGDRPDRTPVEMETVVQGEPLEHVFAIPNTSASALVIQQVTASPGEVTHVDSVIPPQAAGRIAVRVETRAFLGMLNQAVKVEFAGNRPPVRFRRQVRVVAPVELAPQDRVYFFTVKGEPAQREVTIINHLQRPLKLLGVTSSNPLFRPDLKTVEAGQRYQLTVVLDSATPVGRHEGTIRVATDVPAHTPLVVEGLALVKNVVNASLEELDYARVEFDALDRTAVAERTVLVEKYRGTDFRVLRAVTDVPFLSVEVAPQKPGESYLVHVRIQQNRAPRGRFQGLLRIQTNDPATRELKLPIHGEIL